MVAPSPLSFSCPWGSFLSGACYSLPLLRHGLLLLWIPKLTGWMYWDYDLSSQDLYGLAKAPKVESPHSLLLFPCRGDCGRVVLWYRIALGELFRTLWNLLFCPTMQTLITYSEQNWVLWFYQGRDRGWWLTLVIPAPGRLRQDSWQKQVWGYAT